MDYHCTERNKAVDCNQIYFKPIVLDNALASSATTSVHGCFVFAVSPRRKKRSRRRLYWPTSSRTSRHHLALGCQPESVQLLHAAMSSKDAPPSIRYVVGSVMFSKHLFKRSCALKHQRRSQLWHHGAIPVLFCLRSAHGAHGVLSSIYWFLSSRWKERNWFLSIDF